MEFQPLEMRFQKNYMFCNILHLDVTPNIYNT